MDVDGLEVDVNVEGLEVADDGEGRGLLCGADGPGGDMNEDKEEEVWLMFAGLWEAKKAEKGFLLGYPSNGRELKVEKRSWRLKTILTTRQHCTRVPSEGMDLCHFAFA